MAKIDILDAGENFDNDLLDSELRTILSHYRNSGRYDYDFQREALLAQIILDLRKR